VSDFNQRIDEDTDDGSYESSYESHDQQQVPGNDDDVLVLQDAPDPDSVLPVWEPTGNATVDATLEQLHSLTDTDVGEHAATFERIEQSLRATLNGLAAEDESA